MINKTSNYIKMFKLFLSLLFFTSAVSCAQPNVLNKYGLFVVNDIKLLQNEVSADSNKQMKNVYRAIPTVILDLRYTTSENFMHRKLYPFLTTSYLRLPATAALKKVVEELAQRNLTIKIFDAYRPYSVTEEMWEQIKDSQYAADPTTGSGHNRGIAVDVALVDLITKKELPMGTEFDNFSDTAHSDFKNLPENILRNRLILKTVMEKYGFVVLDTEWWHFSLPNAKDFELLNVSFDDLQKLNK